MGAFEFMQPPMMTSQPPSAPEAIVVAVGSKLGAFESMQPGNLHCGKPGASGPSYSAAGE